MHILPKHATTRGHQIYIWRMLGNMTMAVVGSASFGYIAYALDTMVLILCHLPCQGKV